MADQTIPKLLLPSFDPSVRARLATQLESQWRRVRLDDGQTDADDGPPSGPRLGISWWFDVSPALPQSWDPSDRTLIYYAIARGRDMRAGLIDAALSSSPWARIVVPIDQPETAAVEIVELAPSHQGIHGVRPLSTDERDLLDQGEVVERRLRDVLAKSAPPAGATTEYDLIRAFYQLWARGNATMGAYVRSRHPDFFNWVDRT
jgi:hypothetical protein